MRVYLPLLAVIALAFAMLVTAVAHSEVTPPVSLVEKLVAIQPAFQSPTEQSVDARDLAVAIDAVSKGNRQWAALLMTLAVHEGGLREKVRLDQYGPHEGDSFKDKDGTVKHRASGLLQVHANALNVDEWGSPSLDVQIRLGSRLARGAFYMCKRAGVAFPLGVFRVLGTGSCTLKLKGEDARLRTFGRIVRRL